MNKWQLVRHGMVLEDTDSTSNAGELLHYLITSLEERNISLNTVEENTIIEILQQAKSHINGVGMETIIDPRSEELPLSEIDVYVRGIARWLNEIGIHTHMICDGHNKRPATIHLIKPLTKAQMDLITTCAPSSLRIRFEGKKVLLTYSRAGITTLLDMAERLYKVVQSSEALFDFEAETFKGRMIELLNISGTSGNERNIRRFLRKKLDSKIDYTYQDRAGNLLGYNYYGDGPTILLSAHMDTVEELVPDRRILQEGTTLTSSEGILGADDRAGIATILEVLDCLDHSNFNGTIKIALTTREEIGCIGSQKIDRSFLEDVDSAIVVDRRGSRDIVTSCGWSLFCTPSYGKLFKVAGKLAGMPDWEMTSGGLSDAKSFAEFGIPSVNLSAGYHLEHTDEEYVDYRATFETVKLIKTFLHEGLLKDSISSVEYEILDKPL